jgi:arylformamidase
LSTEWIDISMPVTPDTVVWDGDPPVSVTQTDEGLYRLTRLKMSAHTATHMDAPSHFLRDGAAMETMPLDAVLGRCVVAEIADPVRVTSAELEPLALPPGARLLLKTANSRRCPGTGAFQRDFVYISAEAALWMAEHKVRTVGIDYLSVGGFHQDLVETHNILLGAGIWVIEGLRLAHVPAGIYDLACLPLLLPGADGAPARAAVRRLA